MGEDSYNKAGHEGVAYMDAVGYWLWLLVEGKYSGVRGLSVLSGIVCWV